MKEQVDPINPRLMLVNDLPKWSGKNQPCAVELGIKEFLGGARSVLILSGGHGNAIEASDYESEMAARFRHIGITLLPLSGFTLLEALGMVEAVIVGDGNAWKLFHQMHETDDILILKQAVLEGMPYVGIGAGALLACPSIRTTTDFPVVNLLNPSGMALVNFQIALGFDTGSTESFNRHTSKIAGYHRWVNARPVIGLRNGGWMKLEDGQWMQDETGGAVMFRPGKVPVELTTFFVHTA